jgi:hypothetical protein
LGIGVDWVQAFHLCTHIIPHSAADPHIRAATAGRPTYAFPIPPPVRVFGRAAQMFIVIAIDVVELAPFSSALQLRNHARY